MSSGPQNALSGDLLKSREDREIGIWPKELSNLALRVHRAISWIQRAEQETNDPDIAFTCYWIAFNAAYAEYTDQLPESRARDRFGEFFAKLLTLDEAETIHNAIWDRFSDSIRSLLENQYVYEPFWRDAHRRGGYRRWRDELERELSGIGFAMAARQSQYILERLFERLYVLRNQIIHGGATWNSSVNRKQVEDGAAILAFLLPAFVSVMMDHKEAPWGANYYPVVD